jgi:AcrR family transcriptional regulator
MTDRDTKERVLDTAETLFSERGFSSTSLRAITSEAGVNLAAVNYHFGSKDELIRAVFARRAGPVNIERLELLERCKRTASDQPPELECVLRAFLWPALRMAQDPERGGQVMMRLMGRIYAETDEHIESLLIENFTSVAREFGQALQSALPHLDRALLSWRFLFTVGAMAHTMADRQKLQAISSGQCDTKDVENTLEQLVAFIAGGMRAAPPDTLREKTT